MSFAMIGTWRMSFEAICAHFEKLRTADPQGNVVCEAVVMVEDNPYFKSVGFGGLPNIEGLPEFDAAFMNGQTWQIGAVCAVKNIKNPIKVAQALSLQKYNSFLVGQGAELFASKQGFVFQNMLTKRAQQQYFYKLKELQADPQLSPYAGHDTVGMISLDSANNIFTATSTSGLFMKEPGRVGDSPVPGSGFYCEQGVGGAVATGLGEDILKGVLTYQVIEKLKQGSDIKTVAQTVVKEFNDKLITKLGKCGAVSIVVLDHKGNWGVGTNCEFSFVYASENTTPTIYLAFPSQDLTTVNVKTASEASLAADDQGRKDQLKNE